MAWKTTRWLMAALYLAAARYALADSIETSVPRAQAMLIKEDLGDGIFVFRAPEALDVWTSTNTVVVINEEDVVVFDSCTRAVTAKAVIAEIRKLTPKPVRALINSHWHQDHWSGNDEFAKAFPGLRIISSEQTRDYMKRMAPRFFVRGLEIQDQKDREELAAAIKTGKLPDGKPLTPEIRKTIAVLLLLLGLVTGGGSFFRWLNVERAMRRQSPLPAPLIAPILAAGGALVAAVLIVFVIWRPA